MISTRVFLERYLCLVSLSFVVVASLYFAFAPGHAIGYLVGSAACGVCVVVAKAVLPKHRGFDRIAWYRASLAPSLAVVGIVLSIIGLASTMQDGSGGLSLVMPGLWAAALYDYVGVVTRKD
ncbi:hypothetical protein [Burkholderia dolosa]|jgi:Ca2+/Na+ antiporter|uniref:hypothetical protein n=1 Tax=Burkholderia dolosa TaxID=152500 RepID=UPI001B930C8D|nr:hypothetical protein [Burkholderia dolosa]MBR8061163.1 hypothetical protein [Burkholderia dolosa]MBR8460351.1 hypothetical protein [Burkholderia dolosa]MDN7419199.1 hypothetical protein [Burkholderia dolosa]